jgi:threonylcarbamoyladenosine tRNA methylthiotransferase MtaB
VIDSNKFMKIYLDSIGCRLNQSEIEHFARQFRAAGHQLVAAPGDADLALVNTCTVTNAADSDSRGKIRKISMAGAKQVVVTGCWSTMNPKQAANLPGVTRIIPNDQKDVLVPGLLDLHSSDFDLEPLNREMIPGARFRTRAFIKVQDGCDNRCTFCITTIARGSGKSRTEDEILSDIRAAIHSDQNEDNKAKEIVLTGVHLGSWGKDLQNKKHLRDLIRLILEATDVPRLRISSLEPWDLDDEFFQLWEDPRLCRHLHLPLQSGSRTVLKRMARNTTPRKYAALVSAARAASPNIAITTDLIAGFPGESEHEFQETIEFVREMAFSGAHIFTYSARPGTAAAKMPDQVAFPLRKERNAILRKVINESTHAYQRKFINSTQPVLWESVTQIDADAWQLNGLTDNYLRVQVKADQNYWNQISPVMLSRIDDNGFTGTIADPQL